MSDARIARWYDGSHTLQFWLALLATLPPSMQQDVGRCWLQLIAPNPIQPDTAPHYSARWYDAIPPLAFALQVLRERSPLEQAYASDWLGRLVQYTVK